MIDLAELKEKRYVSVICEYNPFHFGHLHQLKQLRSEFDGVVCIMSGNLVQRGSVAIADKYLRAETAIKNGADLVLELPFPWCCASAKDFARAGVHIASNMAVSHLAFGAEDGLEKLCEIRGFMSCADFDKRLKTLVESSKNMSYPLALKTLVGEELGEEYALASEKPNNILALEYLSALEGGKITPFAVKRDQGFKSSSAIRSLTEGEKILAEIPTESADVLKRELGKDFPRDIKKLDSFFIGTLRRMSYDAPCEDLYSTPYDLFKKIVSNASKANSVDELIVNCADKIYTSARVRRGILAIVFGITAKRVRAMPSFTCVLGANETGREILRASKKQSGIDIITKPVKALEASEQTREGFLFAKAVDDVIALSAPSPLPSDRGKTPFII